MSEIPSFSCIAINLHLKPKENKQKQHKNNEYMLTKECKEVRIKTNQKKSNQNNKFLSNT